MRILHVIQELAAAGAERAVVLLVDEAARRGHESAVAAAPGPLDAELDVPRFTLPLVGRRARALPGAAVALRRALRSFEPDVVHAHNPGMALVTALASGRGRRRRSLVTVHGLPEADWDRAAGVLRLAGLPVVACGRGVRDALAARGVEAAATIPPGVTAAPPPAGRAAIERELGVPRDAPLVVTVGRLVPQKRHGLALGALAELPGAVLLVVGDGPEEPALRAEAERLGLGARARFAGLRPDARALLGAADVLAFPSVWEGQPLTVLEAFAAGTPVVATPARGTLDLAGDGESILLAPSDAAGFAAALGRVLEDPALAARLAAGGRRVAAGYTAERMIERYLAVYASV